MSFYLLCGNLAWNLICFLTNEREGICNICHSVKNSRQYCWETCGMTVVCCTCNTEEKWLCVTLSLTGGCGLRQVCVWWERQLSTGWRRKDSELSLSSSLKVLEMKGIPERWESDKTAEEITKVLRQSNLGLWKPLQSEEKEGLLVDSKEHCTQAQNWVARYYPGTMGAWEGHSLFNVRPPI